jgi:hypothetical protein
MPSTVAAAIAAITVEQVVAFVVRTLISVAISSVFSKKPKASASDFSNVSRDQQVTANNPVAPTRVIYGETLVGGTPVFVHATDTIGGDPNYYYENHRAADTVTVANAATFREHIKVQYRTVSPSGEDETFVALTQVISAPAVGEYTVANGVYTFNPADVGRSIQIEYRATVNQRVVGKFLHLVIEFAGHQVHEIGEVWVDNEVVPLGGDNFSTGRFGQHVYVEKYLGTADQAASASLIASAGDKWTPAHRLQGRAYLYVRLLKNPDLFPNGLPNIRCKIKGKLVYDPRNGLTQWSDNVALCVADYLCSSEGLGADYATEIREDLLIAAANVCDEAVSLAGGGTEPRYTCNGAFVTSERPADVLGKLKVAMAGHIVRTGGAWCIHAGAWVTPTVTLTDDDLRGPVRAVTRVSRRELFNRVKGVFASPDNRWQPADFPPVTNATYLAEDGDEPAWLDMDLQFTDSAGTAQRVAKIELERVRQQISVTLPCKLSAYRVQPPETVLLTLADFGWTAKPFEVTGAKLVVEAGEDGAPYLGVDLVLRETAASVFDWSSGEETAVDPAPDTTLPNPFVLQAPGAPVVTESLYETSGSAGVKTRAEVSWNVSGDGQAIGHQLEYRLAGAAGWTVRALVRGLTDVVEDLAPGLYEFRVKSLSALGVSSPYSPTAARQIVGLTAPPTTPTGFSVIKSAGFGLAQWSRSPDLDVQINGKAVVRHSPLLVGADWEDGIIVEQFPGGDVQGLVPLMTGTYMLKVQDSSDNWSSGFASYVATEGMVTGFSTVGTVTEHTAFAGAKTNVAFDAGYGGIKLDGVTTIDSMVTSIDSWPFIDSLGGISATGSYAFAGTLDLSTVATRRFEADIQALSFDTGDTIDNRLDNIDTWDSIDGAAVNSCDVTLYGRFTDDNPAGSPVWGPWTPFFVADFTARAAQFKLDFVSANAQHNIVVTQLAVAAKIPA